VRVSGLRERKRRKRDLLRFARKKEKRKGRRVRHVAAEIAGMTYKKKRGKKKSGDSFHKKEKKKGRQRTLPDQKRGPKTRREEGLLQ